MSKYSYYFLLDNKIKRLGYAPDRREVITELTNGRTDRLTELSDGEYYELVNKMRQMASELEDPALDRMRKKIITLMRKMGYETNHKADMKRIYQWVKHYGLFHKPLNQHSKAELAKLVGQTESMYQSHITQIHR